jgi:hypothetical protein
VGPIEFISRKGHIVTRAGAIADNGKADG